MGSDVVTLIENDHRLLEGLFDQLKTGSGDRPALVAEVAVRLTAHALAEEQEVYPEISHADPNEEDEVEHAYHEHDEAMHLLKKVQNLVASPHFEQALDEFVAAVKHHVDEEEREVLPALQTAADHATLQRLGEAFERIRLEELSRAGFAASTESSTPVDAADKPEVEPADQLADATRDELYELAKKADIAGRSTMNKDQLSEALREQR